ncbi:MAG: type II secretion system protein GspG [Planctomycetes bacterium]|nr:type II secretion system protein GspG [Planctomycetota bacterium]
MARRRDIAGFTLIELMVVIVIIGVLGSLVALNVTGRARDAEKTRVMADFGTIKTAAKLFLVDMSRLPQTIQELFDASAEESPDGIGRRSYLDPDTPTRDPWGTEYVYEVRGDRIFLLSCGPDRVAGTADDIASDGGSGDSRL